MKGYRWDIAIKLLTRKEIKQVDDLCHNADMEMARHNFDGGMIHSFFYDCVAGGIIRARSKPQDYVNTFYDFYIDMRCGRGGSSTQDEVHKILRVIELLVDKKKHKCSLCDSNTEKTAEQQIEEVTDVRENHYKRWGKKQGEDKPKKAGLSERRLQNRGITKKNYVCYTCCQNKLVKAN